MPTPATVRRLPESTAFLCLALPLSALACGSMGLDDPRIQATLAAALFVPMFALIPAELGLLAKFGGLRSRRLIHAYLACLVAKPAGVASVAVGAGLDAVNGIVSAELTYAMGHWIVSAFILRSFFGLNGGTLVVTSLSISTLIPWAYSLGLWSIALTVDARGAARLILPAWFVVMVLSWAMLALVASGVRLRTGELQKLRERIVTPGFIGGAIVGAAVAGLLVWLTLRSPAPEPWSERVEPSLSPVVAVAPEQIRIVRAQESMISAQGIDAPQAALDPQGMTVRAAPAPAMDAQAVQAPGKRTGSDRAAAGSDTGAAVFSAQETPAPAKTADPDFFYEGVCRIWLARDGIVSRHAGAQMFYRMKEIVITTVPDLGPWSGDYPPWTYEMTLASADGQQKTIYFGPETIRDGERVAFINDPEIGGILSSLEIARRGPGVFYQDQLEQELANFACPTP